MIIPLILALIVHFLNPLIPVYRDNLPESLMAITLESICAISTVAFPFIYVSKSKALKDYMVVLGIISGFLTLLIPAEALNIGTIINKKLLASSRIFQIMLDNDTSNAKCLALADAEVAELVAKKDSKITKAKVKDLNLSKDLTIAGMLRDGKGSLVQGNTQIKEGDRVVVFCLSGAIHKVEKLFS